MNQALLVVDVQPAYGRHCESIARQVAQRINNTRRPVLIFWVGEGLTEDTQYDVYEFLRAAGAYRPKLDQAAFVEKDYGFYRPWMDCGMPEETIVSVGRAMRQRGISDSRMVDLVEILGEEPSTPIPMGPMVEPSFADDRLQMFDHFQTCGGGREECLAEMELFLQIHDKSYTRLEHLVY